MKITPALEYERLRQDADSQNKIILHKDGKFYHVYEWSAWLLKTIACTEEFQAQRGDAKILQCNRYNSKHGEYVMLGFPIESVSKYIPQYDTYEEMEDGDLKISITIPEPTKTTEEMTAAFEEWKQTQPAFPHARDAEYRHIQWRRDRDVSAVVNPRRLNGRMV